MIEKSKYGSYGGRDVTLYTLRGDGLTVGVTDFGGIVQFIELSTPAGPKNVCLGFDSIEDYVKSDTYCGATVGRVANRIAGGRFTLGGAEYALDRNDRGLNCNHGGFRGYDRRFFRAEAAADALILTLESDAGDQGFPGRLLLKVRFVVVGQTLKIEYTASSDSDTLWNPTCHIYFNLGGEEGGDVSETMLRINAARYAPIGPDSVPTGKLCGVAGTPFDFLAGKAIGAGLGADETQLRLGRGYDHNFALDGQHAATAKCAATGISLELYTDLPGLQFYTGGGLCGQRGRSRAYYPLDAFCLEPQYFPNAVNTPGFVPPLLKAGESKTHYIKYVFDVQR